MSTDGTDEPMRLNDDGPDYDGHEPERETFEHELSEADRRLTHEIADVTVCVWTDTDGRRFLIVDIDSESDEALPVRVYVNDAPVWAGVQS
jgi:hypothetical protein